MSYITLSAEQARLVAENFRVQVRDPQGNVLGHIEPTDVSPEEIAAARRSAASSKRWFSGQQVRHHLQALEDALNKEGSLDKNRMRQILEEARARDAP